MNISQENKAYFQAEKEEIHLILTGIGDEIYSTVDACQTTQEMWEAIERLQQRESLNIQNVKTNLFWEFGKFTSLDGETMESYYTRFYKLMNEMIRNNLTVATMQVNIQFLQQLQLEWSSCVLSWIEFCFRSIAFCLRRYCILSSEDIAFCLQKILRFIFRRSCVLSSKILRFALEALRFVYFQDLAFCLGSTAFCEEQFVVFCADCVLSKIFIACSRDRPPMLAIGRYPQWRSRFLQYIHIRPNGDALRNCILNGPYKPTIILVQEVDSTDDSPAIPEHTTVEKPMNMSQENKAYFLAKKEEIHLILTGIGDEIYSNVDACQTAQEMWEAIEKLQQCESLNIQDVKTNLFWEFGKFTSLDGETMESYYTRFYKLMNEMIQNNLTVATMQVNIQFLQQLQP
nr:hypothetical protein [Tanacetum cinerariifolium]